MIDVFKIWSILIAALFSIILFLCTEVLYCSSNTSEQNIFFTSITVKNFLFILFLPFKNLPWLYF